MRTTFLFISLVVSTLFCAAQTTTNSASEQNAAYIEKFNAGHVTYVGKETDDLAERGFCVLGMSSTSIPLDENMEMRFELGNNNAVNIAGSMPLGYNAASEMLPGSKKQNIQYMGNRPLVAYNDVTMRIALKNKTTKTLYVDLGNTFFGRGDEASALYVPTSTTNSTTGTTGGSMNLGAVAGGLGVGGSTQQILNGVNIGGAKSNMQQTTVYSQRVVAIPPMSTLSLSLQDLFPGKWPDGVQRISGIRHSPYVKTSDIIEVWFGEEGRLSNGKTLTYTEESSPMRFSTMATYADNEACENAKSLNATFFLREMLGYGKIKGNGIRDVGRTKDLSGLEDVFGFVLYLETKKIYGKRFNNGTFPLP